MRRAAHCLGNPFIEPAHMFQLQNQKKLPLEPVSAIPGATDFFHCEALQEEESESESLLSVAALHRLTFTLNALKVERPVRRR